MYIRETVLRKVKPPVLHKIYVLLQSVDVREATPKLINYTQWKEKALYTYLSIYMYLYR